MKSKHLTIKMMGIIIMALLFSVVSCKKESEETSTFTNIKSVRSEVLANPKIQEMLSVLKNISIQTDANGILCFDNKEDLNEVINILQEYYDKATDADSTISLHDVLNAFEYTYNFSSLHNLIDQETDYLEQNDNLFEYNDPDNHFISNDFIRTIVTPDCEVRVGDRLYILRNGFTLVVTNNDLDARSDILEIIKSSTRSNEELYDLCNQNGNIFIVTENTPQLISDFIYTTSPSNLYQYTFSNFSFSIEQNPITYLWDFGDGTTSTLANPVHTYTTDGIKTVRLSAACNGETKTIEKKVDVKGVKVDFTYSHNNDGDYFFTPHIDTGSDSVLRYTWTFGDGQSKEIWISDDPTVNNYRTIRHRYSLNRVPYTICLTVETKSNLTYYCDKIITTSFNENCKGIVFGHTGNDEHPHYHAYGNKYVKTVLNIYSGVFIKNIMSKTIFLKKKNNGSYKRIKANSLRTSINGHIYYTNSTNIPDGQCGIQHTINLSKTKENQKEVIKSYNTSNSFKVDYHSIGAAFQVKNDGNTVEATGIVLHNSQQ